MGSFISSKAIRFIVIGGLTTAIDFSLLNITVIWLHLYPVYATAVSFLVAASFSFCGHRSWTFQGLSTRKKRIQYPLFLVTSSLGLLFSVSITYIMMVVWGTETYNLAKCASIASIALFNFYVNSRWVFV